MAPAPVARNGNAASVLTRVSSHKIKSEKVSGAPVARRSCLAKREKIPQSPFLNLVVVFEAQVVKKLRFAEDTVGGEDVPVIKPKNHDENVIVTGEKKIRFMGVYEKRIIENGIDNLGFKHHNQVFEILESDPTSTTTTTFQRTKPTGWMPIREKPTESVAFNIEKLALSTLLKLYNFITDETRRLSAKEELHIWKGLETFSDEQLQEAFAIIRVDIPTLQWEIGTEVDVDLGELSRETFAKLYCLVFMHNPSHFTGNPNHIPIKSEPQTPTFLPAENPEDSGEHEKDETPDDPPIGAEEMMEQGIRPNTVHPYMSLPNPYRHIIRVRGQVVQGRRRCLFGCLRVDLNKTKMHERNTKHAHEWAVEFAKEEHKRAVEFAKEEHERAVEFAKSLREKEKVPSHDAEPQLASPPTLQMQQQIHRSIKFPRDLSPPYPTSYERGPLTDDSLVDDSWSEDRTIDDSSIDFGSSPPTLSTQETEQQMQPNTDRSRTSIPPSPTSHEILQLSSSVSHLSSPPREETTELSTQEIQQQTEPIIDQPRNPSPFHSEDAAKRAREEAAEILLLTSREWAAKPIAERIAERMAKASHERGPSGSFDPQPPNQPTYVPMQVGFATSQLAKLRVSQMAEWLESTEQLDPPCANPQKPAHVHLLQRQSSAQSKKNQRFAASKDFLEVREMVLKRFRERDAKWEGPSEKKRARDRARIKLGLNEEDLVKMEGPTNHWTAQEWDQAVESTLQGSRIDGLSPQMYLIMRRVRARLQEQKAQREALRERARVRAREKERVRARKRAEIEDLQQVQWLKEDAERTQATMRGGEEEEEPEEQPAGHSEVAAVSAKEKRRRNRVSLAGNDAGSSSQGGARSLEDRESSIMPAPRMLRRSTRLAAQVAAQVAAFAESQKTHVPQPSRAKSRPRQAKPAKVPKSEPTTKTTKVAAAGRKNVKIKEADKEAEREEERNELERRREELERGQEKEREELGRGQEKDREELERKQEKEREELKKTANAWLEEVPEKDRVLLEEEEEYDQALEEYWELLRVSDALERDEREEERQDLERERQKELEKASNRRYGPFECCQHHKGRREPLKRHSY